MLLETQQRIQEARLQIMRSRELVAQSRRSLAQLSRELETERRQLLKVTRTNLSGVSSETIVFASPQSGWRGMA